MPDAHTPRLFRYAAVDAVLVGAAVVQAALLVALWWMPPALHWLGALCIGATVWWNANTIAHNHLHRPLFSNASANRAFSWLLTVSTSIPQSLWRRRHLWHHAGEDPARKPPLRTSDWLEWVVLLALWSTLWVLDRSRVLWMVAPGFGLGLLLCELQGRGEHAGLSVQQEPGISTYGRLYNLLWCNDGYHREHHTHPGVHWSQLPSLRSANAERTRPRWHSPLPPVLRGANALSRVGNRALAHGLVLLEKLAVRPGPLQRFVLSRHARAFQSLLQRPELAFGSGLGRRIGIVGGGLFPRTALVLGQLLPDAHLVILDAQAAHLRQATQSLRHAGLLARVELRLGHFDSQDPSSWTVLGALDLLVIPLGLVGDRRALYDLAPDSPPRLIHDWIFSSHDTTGCVISWLLLKRLNLVLPNGLPRPQDAA